MTTLTEEEAAAIFDSLLDRIAAGEEFRITRNGKRTARLIADVPSLDCCESQTAIEPTS